MLLFIHREFSVSSVLLVSCLVTRLQRWFTI